MVSVVFTKTGCTRSSEYSVRRDLKTQYWSVTAAADGELKFKMKRTSDPFLSLQDKSLSLSRKRSFPTISQLERPKTRIVYQIYFRRISRYHLRCGRHSEMTNAGHLVAILGCICRSRWCCKCDLEASRTPTTNTDHREHPSPGSQQEDKEQWNGCLVFNTSSRAFLQEFQVWHIATFKYITRSTLVLWNSTWTSFQGHPENPVFQCTSQTVFPAVIRSYGGSQEYCWVLGSYVVFQYELRYSWTLYCNGVLEFSSTPSSEYCTMILLQIGDRNSDILLRHDMGVFSFVTSHAFRTVSNDASTSHFLTEMQITSSGNRLRSKAVIHAPVLRGLSSQTFLPIVTWANVMEPNSFCLLIHQTLYKSRR
jgi:hypothetical protein